jgi:hypothetical protein
VSDGLGVTPSDLDSDGCLCVVVSFVSAARTIDEVTQAAARRAMMSPVLSDFIEFRFADLGPQPGPGGDRSAAVRRITSALLNPRSTAGRNYFALVVADRSAAVIEQVLGDCAASPFLGEMRMRSLGIANSDDRPRAGLAGERTPADIMTSPAGVWSRKEDLVDVLRQFASRLQGDFSARHEPGLSVGELDDLRKRYHERRTQQAAVASASPASGAAPADVSQQQDLLAEDPRSAGTPGTRAGEVQAPDAQAPAAASGSSGPAGSAEFASRARRWIPDRLKRPAQPQATASPDHAEDAAPESEGLVYLLVVGDQSCRDEAALNRSRSALLEVDKKLAGWPGTACQVRMLHGDEDGLRGDLREAGQVSRRDSKRTVAGTDFAAVLESVRASLKRDRGPRQAADATSWPAVVFFAPEPPLADSVAVERFHDLAREASIVWALPRSARALLSGAFAGVPGVRVVIDDPSVADEIAALLSSDTDAVKAVT